MDAQFWDDRYSEQEQLFSGNANGVLVVEVSDMKPGRVLDVGAGEGGDAIWLAERGWTVVATDISAVALARAERAAQAAGLAGRISWQQADLAAAPPAAAAYDLVTASYIPVPIQEGHAALRGLLNVVAPGGTLLFVGHSRAELPPGHEHAGYDPDDYYWPEDIAQLLGEDKQLSQDWTIVASETRERVVPPPPGTHHVHDTVLRAERQR
jgi:ubiquinone/menaquinone biosynthesis C-methylase UbiE